MRCVAPSGSSAQGSRRSYACPQSSFAPFSTIHLRHPPPPHGQIVSPLFLWTRTIRATLGESHLSSPSTCSSYSNSKTVSAPIG